VEIAKYLTCKEHDARAMKPACSKSSLIAKRRKLLGVHVLGQRATEIIHIGQAVLFYGGSVSYFRTWLSTIATLAEALQSSCFGRTK